MQNMFGGVIDVFIEGLGHMLLLIHPIALVMTFSPGGTPKWIPSETKMSIRRSYQTPRNHGFL